MVYIRTGQLPGPVQPSPMSPAAWQLHGPVWQPVFGWQVGSSQVNLHVLGQVNPQVL